MTLHKTFAALLLLAGGLVCCRAQTVSLNGKWDFRLLPGGKDDAALERFFRPDFKAKGFKTIDVPSNWAVLGFEEPVYRGFKDGRASEGFYRLEFDTPEGFSGRRVLLKFGGVWSEADVWLNGEHLGRHSSGYTSFAYLVSGKLKADGSSNLLAVRVKQVGREYKFDTFDDWTLGGIYRDVSLEAMPQNRWIDYVTTYTRLDGNYENADLHVKIMVQDTRKNTLPGNYPSPGEPYGVLCTLISPDGEIVESRNLDVPAHTSTGRELHEVFHLLKPRKWTAETPALYTLRVELKDGGEVSQVWEDRIGLREISTEGGVFRINGQAVKLRGVNRHDEWPDAGRATRREHWLKDITMMKEANINYIRCSHYTPAEGFVRLCDSLGMYLSNEVSLGGAGLLMNDPSYNGAVLVRADETVRRDLNRASIVIWSVGNEDPLTAAHLTAIKYVKGLDPTRPVLIPWRHENWLPEEIDMLSSHYWKPMEYDAFTGNAGRPVVSTEYTHAYGNDGLGSLDDRWKSITRNPAGAGAAVWMWADQGIYTPTLRPSSYSEVFSGDPHLRIDGQGWDGIVDSWRNPTADYFEVKAVYAPVYPLVERIRFTPGEREVSLQIQNDYDFTDLDGMTMKWEIYEEGRLLGEGRTALSGMPHSRHLLRLPIDCIGPEPDAAKALYAHLHFIGADGREIGCNSIELEPALSPRLSAGGHPAPEITENGEEVIVRAGESSYVFDRRSGELRSASYGGKLLSDALKPLLWRKPDPCEQTAISKADRKYGYDLNAAVPSALDFSVSNSDGAVAIRAEVRYDVAENEYYMLDYLYRIYPDGRLVLHYEILPHLSITQLNIVGLAMKLSDSASNLHWLGRGDGDSYPNRSRSQLFGYWGGELSEVSGNKTVRRVDIGYPFASLTISYDGYLWRKPGDDREIGLLSHVFARPEKGRQAGEELPQLRTDTGVPFVGGLSLSLEAL